MKIAVISDIHGNMQALEAVMNDIKEQNCDKVFALGDYAMAGPEPGKCVEWFMSKNFIMIQGNTDLMIAGYSADVYNIVKNAAPVMAESLKNDVVELSAEQKSFLKNLPPQLEVEEEGVKFLLVHGSPKRNNEDILPNLTLDKVEEMLEGVDADVVLCGHTHLPCGYQTTKGQTVVNAGSVGRPFTEKPKSCYLVITIENGKCLFEHRLVDYDREKASEILKNRGFAGSEKLAGTLINPQERHF